MWVTPYESQPSHREAREPQAAWRPLTFLEKHLCLIKFRKKAGRQPAPWSRFSHGPESRVCDPVCVCAWVCVWGCGAVVYVCVHVREGTWGWEETELIGAFFAPPFFTSIFCGGSLTESEAHRFSQPDGH